MSKTTEIRIPDIGDFDKVPVIEVLVSEGDVVDKDQSLITLESDKATMEIPAPAAGRLVKLSVSEGDEVAEGDVIATLETDDGAADEDGGGDDSAPAPQKDSRPPEERESAATTGDQTVDQTADPAPATDEPHNYDCDLLVLGAGPAGYSAAFRAADLGLNVILVERYPVLGGVCLNVGCIPSKALLHVGRVIDEAAAMADHGVRFGDPSIDLDTLRDFKNKTVRQFTGGLAGMAKQRKVRVIQGTGRFVDNHTLRIDGAPGVERVSFARAIIAAGSRVVKLDGLPWDDERLMDSTDALELKDIPGRMLVIGGGIIGLEMACVFQALGARVTIVELMDQLMPGADPDLVKPLHQRLKKLTDGIYLGTRVTGITAGRDSLKVAMQGGDAPGEAEYDRVLVAVGRRPNGDRIGAREAGIDVDERGFIQVDGELRTRQPHIFAVGDIIGQPMLAHKGSYEGKLAAELAAGEKRAVDARAMPSVAYTDPEVAWVGVTEDQAKARGLEYGVGKFPWAASGRAAGMGRTEGFTKLIFDQASDRLIGAGIVGPHAGDLIGELCLALEMGADAADVGLTIHPHPTLSESVMLAAEAHEGTITDLYLPKK